MNCQLTIETVLRIIQKKRDKGKVASYIPELAMVNPESFGVCLTTIDNRQFKFGDFNTKFSIQSIAKVLSLALAYKMLGGKIWERLGVEPSGSAFNSLVQLETDHGIPRNPFINAGALVICDILISHLNNPQEEFLAFIRDISDNPGLSYSLKITESEKSVGYRNMALCYFIKSFGNIIHDPQAVLDFYFKLCSIEMTCEQLSKTFLFMANQGRKTTSGREILTLSQTKRINALTWTSQNQTR